MDWARPELGVCWALFCAVLQTIVRTMNLRRYNGTLSYLPASREFLDQAMMGGAASAAAAAAAAAAGPEGQFKGPAIEDLESAGEWQTLEGEFVLLWAQNMPWAATDMHAAPMAQVRPSLSHILCHVLSVTCSLACSLSHTLCHIQNDMYSPLDTVAEARWELLSLYRPLLHYLYCSDSAGRCRVAAWGC